VQYDQLKIISDDWDEVMRRSILCSKYVDATSFS